MSNITVTVYTTPDCSRCDATKKALDLKGIRYDAVDVTKDVAAGESLKARGFLSAPIVETDFDIWSGFRPDKILELAAELNAEETS